jgi:hypothetical protein
MTANARVQKHREKLRAAGRRRLDVHLPNDLIEAACTIAIHHKRYLRDIVYYALKDYVTRHAGSGWLLPVNSRSRSNARFR